MDSDGVLDLSTGPARRSPAMYDQVDGHVDSHVENHVDSHVDDDHVVKVEPSSPRSVSESDSGLDIVDSARNSTDSRVPGSPSVSVHSGLPASPKTEPDLDLSSVPPVLMLPHTLPPGLSLPTDSKDMFKMFPYDGVVPGVMMNPALMASIPGFDGSPFTGSVTQLMTQRRRRTGQKRPASGGESDSSAQQSKKAQATPVPTDKKDESYWERRRRNNDAAKRSRDMRRLKEEEIAKRAAYLEQENVKLRAQVAFLKNETAKLHYILYNRV